MKRFWLLTTWNLTAKCLPQFLKANTALFRQRSPATLPFVGIYFQQPDYCAHYNFQGTGFHALYQRSRSYTGCFFAMYDYCFPNFHLHFFWSACRKPARKRPSDCADDFNDFRDMRPAHHLDFYNLPKIQHPGSSFRIFPANPKLYSPVLFSSIFSHKAV